MSGPGPELPGTALPGGVGNGGAVVRVGDTVRRPPSVVSRAVAVHLAAVGFDRAPRWLGTDDEGRDVFTYVAGDVAVAPYPEWAHHDAVLAEVGGLLRDFHRAMAGFDPGPVHSADLADPRGGTVFCHNDLCLDNVVFRDGRAVALLDFDAAALGRALWDVARTARMCVPMAVPGSSRSWSGAGDWRHRLGVLTRAYGVDPADGADLADLLLAATRQGQDWVRARVGAGEPAFVAMWQRFGLADRYTGDLAWIEDQRGAVAAAVAGGAGGDPVAPYRR